MEEDNSDKEEDEIVYVLGREWSWVEGKCEYKEVSLKEFI